VLTGVTPSEGFRSEPLVCPVCQQPECPDSFAGVRPPPGVNSTRLEPGQLQYRGYGDFIVHPDEAVFVLHRGYVLLDGEPQVVSFTHNEPYVTGVRVKNSDPDARPADAYVAVVGK